MVTYQLKCLEGRQIKLKDVLYNESILFYFMEFLDQKGSKAAYEFYIIAENFEEDIETKLLNGAYDVECVVSDAMYIYERYFSMKCELQLIADDKLRIVLENNICREDGPQANCFCIPMAYAWTALSDVYLPIFLLSDVFESYVEHLQKTSQHAEDLKSCSSRSSLSVDDNLPLLVQSDSKLNLFDDKGLEDFWFKPQPQNASRLTLGHVNELGIFSSQMEPEPVSGKQTDSSVSKLGKAMKNLLRGETPEKTEQLAWERARKIIADIQKETQG